MRPVSHKRLQTDWPLETQDRGGLAPTCRINSWCQSVTARKDEAVLASRTHSAESSGTARGAMAAEPGRQKESRGH